MCILSIFTCFCYTFCNAPLWGYEMKLSTCNLHDICAMLIREKGVRGHPKLLIVKWLGVIVLQLGLWYPSAKREAEAL